MKLVYDRRYNFAFSDWVQKLHPFDGKKYARAWTRLRETLGANIAADCMPVPKPIGADALDLIHDDAYLLSLNDSKVVAKIIEVPPLAKVPNWILDRLLLTPMRWATAGTVVAARTALTTGLAVNLGGGFHHAKPASGEGFCVYSDIATAVAVLRREGLLAAEDRIAYVDLDAHLGNGVATCFAADRNLFHFDMFNERIYPFDPAARERVDCSIPVSSTTGPEYLRLLRGRLPPFLDSVGRTRPVRLAIYTAGTDVFVDDELGGLNLSASEVLERDAFVVEELRRRAIPTVVVTGGGYGPKSFELIADSIAAWHRAGW